MSDRPLTDWLPITRKEVEERGWEELDVILISGDAYVANLPCDENVRSTSGRFAITHFREKC